MKGSIVKITRKTASGTPKVYFRFRYGRSNKPIYFKTRTAAEAYQRRFNKTLKTQGVAALDVINSDAMAHIKTAIGLLEAQQLDASHLVTAVRQYTAAINPEAMDINMAVAYDRARKTEKFQALSNNTTRNYKSRWWRFVKHVGTTTPLRDVTIGQIEAFINSIPKSTRKHYYVDLRAFYSLYLKTHLRLIQNNPFDHIPPPIAPKANRREFYRADEVHAVLDTLSCGGGGDVLLFFVLAFFTGARTSEIHRIKRSFFSPDLDHLYFPEGYTKTETDRLIELTSELRDWLQSNDTFNESKGVLFKRPLRYYRETFKEACEVASVDYKGLTTRQSYASHALIAIHDSNVSRLQAAMGHSIGSKVTLNTYISAITKEEAYAYFTYLHL